MRKAKPDVELLLRMRAAGATYEVISKTLGVTTGAVAYHLEKHKDLIRYDARPQTPTLCWGCMKAVGPREKRCSWSREFIPVEGWTAQETKLGMGHGKPTQSYRVEKCPLYVEG